MSYCLKEKYPMIFHASINSWLRIGYYSYTCGLGSGSPKIAQNLSLDPDRSIRIWLKLEFKELL